VEAIPAFLYFILLFMVPRSPRWLIQRLGLVDIAEQTLIKIGGPDYASFTIAEIQKGIAKKEVKGTFAQLFDNRMRTIMIIALGIAFFQQITGINAIFYYAPTIFEQAGGSTDSSFLQAIVVGLTNLVFTLVAIRFIDRLGRKPLLIIGTATMAIALSLSTLAFSNATYTINIDNLENIANTETKTALTSLEDQSYNSQKDLFNSVASVLDEDQLYEFKRGDAKQFISINATLVLIAILLYVAAFAISLGPVMWTLLSEIFPSNIKGIAISVVGFFNSLVSYTVTQFFPWELTNLGPTMTFAIYAIMAVLSLLFVMRYVIETKGKSLEEVEELLVRH
ncbi:MAG: MFS transporter, partial [Winogradskyella sp.]|nr:MFS transporter [Winogradskyella sp.]